jgi:hypothetical protein
VSRQKYVVRRNTFPNISPVYWTRGRETVVNWYRSFYWRIGVSFVVLVIVVLVAQSLFFGYWLARANLEDTEHSPNNRAARVAADLGSLLAQQPAPDLDLDIKGYLASSR